MIKQLLQSHIGQELIVLGGCQSEDQFIQAAAMDSSTPVFGGWTPESISSYPPEYTPPESNPLDHKVDKMDKVNEVENDDYLDSLNQQMLMMKDIGSTGEPSSDQWLFDRAREGLFPPSSDPFLNIESVKQFKEVLQAEKVKYDREDLRYYVRHTTNTTSSFQGIIAICGNCRMSRQEVGPKKIVLNLNKKSNVFLIKLFDNKHNHVFTETASHNGRHTAAFIPLLRREFEKAPRDTPILEFISSMAKKYRTKPKRIQAALYFFRKTSFEFRQITNLAKLLNLRVWFKNNFHEEDYCDSNDTDQLLDEPELLMFSHHDSFSRVKHLEEVCYLMLLNYKLRGSGDKQWDVFILSALNLSYMLEPFAFVFIEVGHRNLVNVATILHKLFTLFRVMPRVMVTPSEDLYTELCLLLADKFGFRGLHLLDPIIQIDRIGATLDRYEDLSYFKAVLLSRSKAEYLSSLQRLSANCPASSAIRYNLNRVMKNAHRMIFGCLETDQYIGTIFDYSANKIIFDIIRENLMRFVCKYNDQDSKKAEPVKLLHGMTQSEKSSQKKCKVNRDKGPAGGDYTKLNFSKLTYMRCVRLLMHVMNRSIPEVTNTSNYDLKPYETVVEIQDMVLIRRCIKSNLLYVFGDQYGKTFYLDYCEARRGESEDMRVLYVFDRRAKSWFVVAPFPVYCSDGSIEKIVLKCNCLFSLKTGVPCAHEIQATLLTRSSLFDLFKSDFVISQKFKHTGRPKSTRRNTQK